MGLRKLIVAAALLGITELVRRRQENNRANDYLRNAEEREDEPSLWDREVPHPVRSFLTWCGQMLSLLDELQQAWSAVEPADLLGGEKPSPKRDEARRLQAIP